MIQIVRDSFGFDKMIEVIRDPNSVAVVEQNHPLPSFTSKLKRFIDIIQTAPGSKALNHNVDVMEIALLLTTAQDPSVVERAYRTLIALERVDPTLQSILHEASCFLYHPAEKDRALAHLNAFIRGCMQPLKLRIRTNAHQVKESYVSSNIEPLKRNGHPFWKIKKIMITHRDYINNLLDIADFENFEVCRLKFSNLLWLRDPFLILSDQELLVPGRMNTGDGLNPLIDSIYGCRWDVIGEVAAERSTEKLLAYQNVREAPFYFEGGNLIPAINEEGAKFYLSGSNNHLLSVLNAHYLFSKDKESIEREMNLLRDQTLKLLQVVKKLDPTFLFANATTYGEKRHRALVILATLSHLEKQMAKTLGHPVITIGDPLSPLVEFHLDLFLMPAPGGAIFIQDFALCKKVLCQIKEKHVLTDEELERLRAYWKVANVKEKLFGGQLKEIAQRLKEAKFRVIPMPGSFDTDRTICVNFMNGIIGENEKGIYCITNGSSHSLDRYLRDAFTSLMHAHGVSSVYFTGKKSNKTVWDPYTPNEYACAEKNLKACGGIHCRTQDLRTDFPELKEKAVDLPSIPYVGDALPHFFKLFD